MKVVVTGATGNVGGEVLAALAADPGVDEIVGVARRRPDLERPKTRWVAADVGRDDLREAFCGADAVVHLAWLIQPARREDELWRTNVAGSEAVARAAAEAGAAALVHASSVGVYSPGPKGRRVPESWPRDGVVTSLYSRHKAAAERTLDRVEADHPGLRVVRMRPGLVFRREAATEVRRLFAGRLFPPPLARPARLRVLPDVPGLILQAVHGSDVADAFARAVRTPVRGAFNVAAEPPLEAAVVARALGARTVRVPQGPARAAMAGAYAARLIPSEPGWLDLALRTPLMDTGRARRELGWEPRVAAIDALLELLEGVADGADASTPPLSAPPPDGGRRRRQDLAGCFGGSWSSSWAGCPARSSRSRSSSASNIAPSSRARLAIQSHTSSSTAPPRVP